MLLKVLVPAFFAHGQMGTPVKVGMAAIAVNLCLNLLFMVPLQHVGPALATSVSAIGTESSGLGRSRTTLPPAPNRLTARAGQWSW